MFISINLCKLHCDVFLSTEVAAFNNNYEGRNLSLVLTLKKKAHQTWLYYCFSAAYSIHVIIHCILATSFCKCCFKLMFISGPIKIVLMCQAILYMHYTSFSASICKYKFHWILQWINYIFYFTFNNRDVIVRWHNIIMCVH